MKGPLAVKGLILNGREKILPNIFALTADEFCIKQNLLEIQKPGFLSYYYQYHAIKKPKFVMAVFSKCLLKVLFYFQHMSYFRF